MGIANLKKGKSKLSRRHGRAIWPEPKLESVVKERMSPPGQHLKRTKLSPYGVALSQKKQVQLFHLMPEKQFKNTYKKAVSISKGAKGRGKDVSEVFMQLLASRLSSVLYNSSLAPTMHAARQLINHKHVMVNGKVVNKPSYSLKSGDVVSIRDSKLLLVTNAIGKRDVPSYITVDPANLAATYNRVPILSELAHFTGVDLLKIIELYSK